MLLLAKRLRTHRDFDSGGQWDFTAELTPDCRNRFLENTNKTCAYQDPGERSSNLTRHYPDMLDSVQESSAEAWVSHDLHQGRGH